LISELLGKLEDLCVEKIFQNFRAFNLLLQKMPDFVKLSNKLCNEVIKHFIFKGNLFVLIKDEKIGLDVHQDVFVLKVLLLAVLLLHKEKEGLASLNIIVKLCKKCEKNLVFYHPFDICVILSDAFGS
jgi:hypothetical protein